MNSVMQLANAGIHKLVFIGLYMGDNLKRAVNMDIIKKKISYFAINKAK